MKNMTRRTFSRSAIAIAAGLSSATARAEESLLTDFHMPLETAPHHRTFMQWPVSIDVYGEKFLKRTQSSIADIANAISRFEDIVVMASGDHVKQAKELLNGAVEIWDIPTDDLWCRDSGPTFVVNQQGELAVSHIEFNGWGEKQTYNNDGLVTARVAEKLGLALLPTGLKGEQGGLEHDGAGLVLAHASSWVNPNRNAGSAKEVGAKLLAAVGGRKMIWAPGIIGADITDYHIDALARFVSAGRVIIQLPAVIDPDDPWSKSAYETYDILRDATTIDGKALDIIVVEEPLNIRSSSKNFVSSYMNYYVCNNAVICSNFGDKQADGKAKEIMQEIYPGREIVTLNTDPIGESGGGIHCATQQQPKGQV